MLRILDKFKTYLIEHKKAATTTCTAYVRDIQLFLDYLASRFRTPAVINADDFKLYFTSLQSKKLSTSTATRKVSALKLFAYYLHEKHGIKDYSDTIGFDHASPLMCAPAIIPAILSDLRKKATQFENLRTYCLLYLIIEEKVPINQIVLLDQTCFTAERGVLQLESPKNIRILALKPEFAQALAHYISLIPYKTNLLFPVKFGAHIKHMPRQAVWSLLRSTLLQHETKHKINNAAHSDTDTELQDLYRKIHPRA